MLPWIQKIQEQGTIKGFNVIALIPQARSATETRPPFDSELTEFVVFVGYDPRRGTFVVSRFWKHTIQAGFFDWDQGDYDQTDFESAMKRAVEKSFM